MLSTVYAAWMKQGNAETTVGKKKVKKLEKKKYKKRALFIPMTVFPFHMLHFPVPQGREIKKIFDVFLLTLLMHLVHMTANSHRTHPASVPRKKGCVSLSAAKVALEIRWRWAERRQGWWGKRTGKWDTSDGLLSDPRAEGGKQISSAGTFLHRNNLGHLF